LYQLINHNRTSEVRLWYNIVMHFRKDPLVNGHFYHIINRSIAKYIVFNNEHDYSRFIELIDLYRFEEFTYKYSDYLKLTDQFRTIITDQIKTKSPKLVDIVAYCLMPTHIHLLLKQTEDGGISKYMAKVLNSYSRHFNILHQRKGPLWEGRFKSILVSNDDQMLHLTRYIHLNPTSAGIVKKPEDWQYSSYHEYIDNKKEDTICDFESIINMNPKQYSKFVLDRKDYQRKLSQIKNLLLDNYSG